MAYIEKEIKLRIEDPVVLAIDLKKKGACFIGKAFQRTIRFDDRNASLASRGIALRVRSGLCNVVTVKRKLEDAGGVSQREEYEAKAEDIEIFRNMFITLGFDCERIMEKYRMDFEFNSTLVSIDEMPFGMFVEIEGEEDKISETVNLLGLYGRERILGSYWDVFEEYKKEHGLAGDNIEFEKSYIFVLKDFDLESMRDY